MRGTLKFWPLLLAAWLAAGENDPSWKSKRVEQWDQEDARQVLADSPWSGSVELQRVRDLSPDERRNGGDMQAGVGKGVGLKTILFGDEEALERARMKPDPGKVSVRWESANPVRVAEQKAGETEAPALESDFYAIAVYDMPTPKRWNIENELRGIAALKRPNKKDLKPARVVILRKDDGKATVVYLFRRSVEITKRDGSIEFSAQIGRLFVTRTFSTREMMIRDQLEL